MTTQELFSLKGKVALITGGRAMYGKGATLALADAGADIYLASHTIESAKEFVEELKREKGVKVEAIAFDQGDIASIENLVQTVIDKAGRIDVFVNCSRILPHGHGGTGWEEDPEAMDDGVRINTSASLYMNQLVGRQMISQKSGSIITFGSMMGLIGIEENNYGGNPQMAAGAHGHIYSLDKSGVTSWVRHAAAYYGRYGIRVNALCPGGLRSDRTNPVFEKEYSKHTMLGRLADGDDIKGPIALLASDAGKYLTGLSIPVDGGYTCE
ncbi:MAG: SDR family oxidoreductase [Lachnospiraceae bacterium]|nr:SDR family oxidoreductase [Lachnospiraceae bacterium]MBQ6545117.1 SDR family oxidoreductase [Lachnospiraceae bacterium]